MKKNNILIELLVGIIALGVILQIVCIVVAKHHLYNAVGLWVGIGLAWFMAIHMKRTIEDSLDMDEESAVKHARNAYALRTGVAVAVIALVVLFKLGNPITLVIGIFPLKGAAYLQPLIHKVFQWYERKKDCKNCGKEE